MASATALPASYSLETFLRGMETVCVPQQLPDGVDLETFLRGMETGATARTSGRPLTLKPSLEGWKHRPI